jgi:hypothetical protein
VAKIIAGVGSSHVPAIGAALDNGKTEEPYWKRVFSASRNPSEWMAQTKPDVAIVVYNDHASAFSVEMIPTFALGCAAEFPPADEGWGPRPVPVLKGHPALAAHIAQSVILDEFDLTIVNKMEVDHGLTVPMNLLFGTPKDLAVPQHPARGQRRHVSAADRAIAATCWARRSAGGRVLSRGSEGGDLRHRRAVASDQRPPRRADQQQVGQELSRQSVQGSEEAHAHSAPRIYARGRRRGHRDGDVADHARRARRQGRRGLPLLHRAGVEHRGRAHHSRERAQGLRHAQGRGQEQARIRGQEQAGCARKSIHRIASKGTR